MRQRAGIGNMLGSPLGYSRSAAPIEQAGIRSASTTPEKRDQKSHSGLCGEGRNHVGAAEIVAFEEQWLPMHRSQSVRGAIDDVQLRRMALSSSVPPKCVEGCVGQRLVERHDRYRGLINQFAECSNGIWPVAGKQHDFRLQKRNRRDQPDCCVLDRIAIKPRRRARRRATR
jgi:hypothetical protein